MDEAPRLHLRTFHARAPSGALKKRFRPLDPLKSAPVVHGFPQISLLLQVQPKLRRRSEHARQHECSIGSYATLATAYLIHNAGLHSHSLGKRGLGETVRNQKLIAQHLSNSGGLTICLDHRITCIRVDPSRHSEPKGSPIRRSGGIVY